MVSKNRKIEEKTQISVKISGYFPCLKKMIKSEAESEFYQIIYARNGSSKICVGEKNHILNQGSMILIKPCQSFAYLPYCKKGSLINIVFEIEEGVTKGIENKVLRLSNYEQEITSILIKEFESQEEGSPFCREQVLKSNLELLLISLIRGRLGGCKAKGRAKERQIDKTVSTILEYLQTNLYQNFTLTDISRDLFLSKATLKSLFKAQTGVSVMQYAIGLKIDEAKRLIEAGEFTFTEIAYKLNLNSAQYFSRLFKNRTGLTPSEYSKLISQ